MRRATQSPQSDACLAACLHLRAVELHTQNIQQREDTLVKYAAKVDDIDAVDWPSPLSAEVSVRSLRW